MRCRGETKGLLPLQERLSSRRGAPPLTCVGGLDSEKTRLGGSAASMFATSVDPHLVSWYTKPFGGRGVLPSSSIDFCHLFYI